MRLALKTCPIEACANSWWRGRPGSGRPRWEGSVAEVDRGEQRVVGGQLEVAAEQAQRGAGLEADDAGGVEVDGAQARAALLPLDQLVAPRGEAGGVGVHAAAAAQEVDDEAAVEAGAALGSQALVADHEAAIAEQLGEARRTEVAAAGQAQRDGGEDGQARAHARAQAEVEVVAAAIVGLARAGRHGEAAGQRVDAQHRLQVHAIAEQALVELDAEAEAEAVTARVALGLGPGALVDAGPLLARVGHRQQGRAAPQTEVDARREVEVEVAGALVVDAEADLAERVVIVDALGREAGDELEVARGLELAAHSQDAAREQGAEGGRARLAAGGEAGDALALEQQQLLAAVAPRSGAAVEGDLGEEAVVAVVLAALVRSSRGSWRVSPTLWNGKSPAAPAWPTRRSRQGPWRRGASGIEREARASRAAKEPTPRVAPMRRRS